MIAKVFVLTIAAMAVAVVLIWSLITVLGLFRRETDEDHQITRAAARELREATEDLEDSIRRAERRKSTTSKEKTK